MSDTSNPNPLDPSKRYFSASYNCEVKVLDPTAWVVVVADSQTVAHQITALTEITEPDQP